jgi:hypothetical protein
MPASRRVTRAVSEVLDLAPRRGEVSLARLVESVAEDRGRPIELKMAAHELGHLVLGHEGISVVEAARDRTEFASSELIGYMLNQRTGCMGPSGEDLEQEAEDFAALLIYRLGRLPSDRASIVQVRLGEAFG